MDILEVTDYGGGNRLWGRLADAISLAIWLGDLDCTTSDTFWKTVEDVW